MEVEKDSPDRSIIFNTQEQHEMSKNLLAKQMFDDLEKMISDK